MNKARVKYHVGTALVATGFAIVLLVIIGFTSNAAAEASPGKGPHKDYVCKYVGTPGVNERLQTGQNPIWVDSHATQGTWFNDKHGRSYVLIANTVRLNPEPSASQCPPVTPPTSTTTTTSSTTTATTPSSSTTSTPPTTTTTTATTPSSTTTSTTSVTTPPTTTTTTSATVPPVTFTTTPFTPPVFTPPIDVTTPAPVPPVTTTNQATPPLRPLSPPINELPYTGSSTLPLVALAGVLVLLGLVLRFGNRVQVVRNR